MSLNASPTHRTQFDRLRLPAPDGSPIVASNRGRQLLVLDDGAVITAATSLGEWPSLFIWRDLERLAAHPLNGKPSAPCVLPRGGGAFAVWLSVDEYVFTLTDNQALSKIEPIHGVLQDTVLMADGSTLLAIRRGNSLNLVRWQDRVTHDVLVHPEAGEAVLAVDSNRRVHVAYERFRGIDYCVYCDLSSPPLVSERPAGAFAQSPTMLCAGDEVFIAYLGESGTIPPDDAAHWSGKPWNRRIGVGGYIAVLRRRRDGGWDRFNLADSKQFAKPLWSKMRKFGYDYPSVDVRVRMEEYSAPALTIGPDGVVQAFWADTSRRWIYVARFLGKRFSAAAEVFGPVEQLTGPPLVPTIVRPQRDEIPVVIPAKDRLYLDELRLPQARIAHGRTLDFVQLDDLARCDGLEVAANAMCRFDGNPVIRIGPTGSYDDSGVVARVDPDGDGWRATPMSKSAGRKWRRELSSFSPDGVHWERTDHLPQDQVFHIDGKPHPRVFTDLTHVRDDAEPNPQRRYKGLWADAAHGWGAFVPVTSPDGLHWTSVADTRVFPVSDGIYIWIDAADVPQRRFKAIGSSRSFCGRVCVQFTSADGMHWDDVRDSLDWDEPFSADPYFCDGYASGQGTGRVLIDPWAGPDDEDELHGGLVFREGDRWLLHYMKWTADGHIFCALASSRDGIHFTRVAGGTPTLPLGAPGTWDSGRIALHNPPALVGGDTWRQYYVGSGWKHGFEGTGPAPHPTSGRCTVYSPTQVGFAEIARGRWCHLRVTRDRDEGMLVTVPLQIDAPHAVTINVAGLQTAGASLRLAIVEPDSFEPVPGFGFGDCDSLHADGLRQPVSWQGNDPPTGPCRLGACLQGHRLNLYGITLTLRA